MFQLALVEVIQAEREREIETAIRRRQLLRTEDGASEPMPSPIHADKGRMLTPRVRPSGS